MNVTEQEFYESEELIDRLEASARILTGKKVKVRMSDKQNTAATNGRMIKINYHSNVVEDFSTEKLRFKALMGMFYHECAHMMYLDYDEARNAKRCLMSGSPYGKKPVLDTPEKIAFYEEFLEGLNYPEVRKIIMRVFHKLDNYFSDNHDERAIIRDYGRTVKNPILLVREHLFINSPTISEYPRANLAKMLGLIFSIARFSKISGSEKIIADDPEAQEILAIKDRINLAATSDSMFIRYSIITELMLMMWPHIKQKAIENMYSKSSDDKEHNEEGEREPDDGCGDSDAEPEDWDDDEENDEEGEKEPSGSSKSKSSGSTGKPSDEAEDEGDGSESGSSGSSSDEAEGEGDSSEAGSDSKSDSSGKSLKELMDEMDADTRKKLMDDIDREIDEASKGIDSEDSEDDDDSSRESSPEAKARREKADAEAYSEEAESSESSDESSDEPDDGESEVEAGSEADDSADEMTPDDDDTSADELKSDIEDDIKERKAVEMLEGDQESNLSKEAKAVLGSTVWHKDVRTSVNRNLEVTDYMQKQYETVMNGETRSIVKKLVKKVSEQIKEMTEEDERRNLSYGPQIYAQDAYRRDKKFFGDRRLPSDAPEMAIAVLVDQSGSMSFGDRIGFARKAATVAYEFATALGVPVCVTGHSMEFYRKDRMNYDVYTEFDDYSGMDKYRLMNISADGDNRDGAALELACHHLMKRPEAVKIMIVISDGLPSHQNASKIYEGSPAEKDVKEIVRKYKKKGIEIICYGIGDGKETMMEMYGKDAFIDISDLQSLPNKMAKLIKKRIEKEL